MKKWINIFLILLGSLILILFIWLRFIRERLPRDIPFNLTEFSLLLLVYICITYIYILYGIYNKKTNNTFIQKYKDFLYKPLEALDEFIIKHKYIETSFHDCIVIILNFIETTNYTRLHLILEVIPKGILISLFLLDIFYLKCICYFYKGFYLFLLLLVTKYILYALTKLMNQRISELEKTAVIYCYDLDKEDPKNLEDMYILSIPELVKKQTIRNLLNLHTFEYLPTFNVSYWEEETKRLKALDKVPSIGKFLEKTKGSLKVILNIYKNSYRYNKEKLKYDYINNIITLCYFIGWGYILFISVHTLPSDSFAWLWEIHDNEEPFAAIKMNTLDSINNYRDFKQ